MAFDPSQPFDIVSEPEDQPQDKPAFDPSKPFEVIGEREEDVAGKLETLSKVATDKPDEAARISSLSKKTGAPYDLVKTAPDQFENHVNQPDWKGLSDGAPKTAKYLGEDPERFQQARDDTQALADMEKFRSELKTRGIPELKNNYGTDAGSVFAANNQTGDGAIANTANPDVDLENYARGLGIQFNQALKKAEIGLNMAAGDLAGLSGDDAEAVKRGQLRQLEGANNESNAATPTFDTKTAEFVYGGASSLVQTAPSLAAGILNPTLGLTIAGAQTAAPVYADTRARGGTAGESALNAIGQGAVEVITEKLPIGFASQAFGKMKVSDFFKQFAGREMLGEQAATLAQDGLDTAIANPDKTWEEYLAERPEAAIRTMFAVGVTSATMAGVQYAANKTTGFHAEKDVAATQHINDIKTELAILENSKLAQRSPETMHEYLDHIDGEEKQTVFVDPSQLFNQGGVARADLERIAPSAVAQIDEALDKGGLIEIPKNELLIGLMGKPDIQGNVVQFLKADANADSLHDINTQREGLSQEMYDLASKQIEKSKDATKLTTQRDEIIQHLQDSMSAAGMDDAGNKHRAAMIASGIVSQAIREKVDPVELYKQQVGNISNAELQGGVFNQQNPFTQENGFETVEEIDFSLPEGFTSLEDGSNVKASASESGDQNGQQKFEFDQFGDRKTDPNEKDIQLSNFPKERGWRVYDKARLLEGIRLASDKIRGELGRTGSSESQATRELTSGPLGPFTSSSVSSEIKGDRLFIYYVGQEQAELGLTDEAALTVILNKTGELVVNGPPADSATFEEFKKLGWADFAEMKDGEKSDFWTSLDGFEGLDGPKGLLNPGTAAMLADAHARLRAWRGEDKVLINWVRYTGATGNALNGRKGVAFFQNQAAPRGTFNPITREIGLTNAADLSTFLHESGHLFLEITADLAAREGASEAVKKDMDTAFQWFGITGESFDDRMAAWNKMTLDEKRPYHEKWAESFEQYLFEGKAPSMELRDAFRNFRQWLTHVYKSLSQFVGTHDGAKLNDEMRSVFDRMLATEQQIEEMEAARGMLPLFSKKPAGMTESEWTSYRQAADEATQSAVEQLTSRSLRDMKWLANAKNKAIRKLQREAADERRVARMEARQQVLSQPVYRAWQFLKAPIEGSKAANKKAKQSEGVDSKRDSLFAAIAKLGGLNREEMMAQMGYGAKDFAAWKSGIFGKPVVRKDGGLSLDAMSEALSQHNYLTVDEHGKVEIGDLLDKAMEEMRGNKQYSTDADYDVLLGETQYAAAPDAEQVDFVGGRLSRQAIREMYDDADLANMQGDENPIGKLQLEGYTQIGVSEDKGNERQYTLFGEDGDNSPADNKRKNAKKSSGNVEPAAQVPGRFATTVGNEKTKTINAGFEKLNTPDKVAFATSHISKNPQEALLVVVTDKNHKPISMLRHSLGEKAAATVDQGIVAGWAVNVPNGAHVWLSHNHPSGKPKLSQADERVSNAVADLLNGTHLQHHGIMAVTHEGLFGWTDGSSRIESKEIPAPDNDVPVDVVEREFKTTGRLSDDYNDGITGFNDAVSAARDISGGESGLMLLDAQYRPIGFVPVDFAKSLSIRATKLQSDILGAIELSNASGVISYTKDTSTNAEKGILNVGGLIESARVTPVDAIIDRGGSSVISWANMGARISSSTFQQPAYHGTPYKFDKFSLEHMGKKGGDTSGKRSLESLGVMSDEGLHPDTVADLFGLSSGDELVRKLLTMPDPVSEIERLTDEIMLQRHSDLATPEGRERAAESAIHNEARAKFIATELAMLNRAIGKPRMIMAAAKEYAGQIVSALRVRDLKTGQYDAAEAKASKEADKALRDGNTAAAALAKRNQVLHNMTAKMVRDAQDEVEKAVRYLKKFDKPNKKIDIDYQEQIDTLLERYDLRQKTLKAIERSQNLAQWIEQQKAEGLEPVIPDYLQDEAKRTNYKMLTVEELRGLVDAVKNIEHLGRLKNRLLTDKAKRELNALADGIGKSIADNGGDVKPSKLERNTAVDRLSDLASGFFSMHRKLASIVRQLDGWKDGGILWDAMIRPMNEAGDHEAVMHEKSTMALAEVFASLKDKKLTKKLYIPMIATSLSYEGRLAVALNWGNEGNRQRLMDGDKWGIGEVNAILATLTAEDWKFVQGVWDHIATYKDEIGAQQRRLTGVEPSWVDATPFEIKTADGQTVQVQGGYYPAKYDTTRSTQALSNEAAGNVFDQWRAAKGQGKTRDGFTKSRATQVKDRPLRKDFGVITQHITEVTHRLAWQDWVVDMNRLIKKEQVDSSIRAHYGNEILEEIRKAIEDITTGDVTAQSSYEQAINHLRIGTTIVGLGWNLTTSLLQPFGLTQSMVRIGPKWIAKGLATWIGNPTRMNERTDWVYSKSDFMRLRGKTMMREMNEILNTVRKEKLSKIEATYFYGIQKMQVIADMPTWLGQYEKSMAEFDGDESKAIALADQAVLDAQGGGQNKDLARIQRGGPLLKLWTNFYSYFNTTYNLTREVAGRTNVKDPASVAKAAVDVLLLYTIPSVMVSLLKGAIIGDDDEDELADRLWRDQLGYLFGSMVGLREISAAFSGFSGYSGPAGTRFFSEIARLGKQAEQGEADAPFLKSLNNVGGILFHYPAGQINRTIEGASALYNGETDSPAALIFGKPK